MASSSLETGSTAIVRSKAGELVQEGGHPWVAWLDGSGFWIGLNAIRSAYRDFASDTDSVLLQRFRQVYGLRIDDGRAFIAKLRDLAIADPNMKKEIARLAASVCDAAVKGDPAAEDIVKKHSEDHTEFPRASSAASSLEVISLLALPSLRLAGCYPTKCIDPALRPN